MLADRSADREIRDARSTLKDAGPLIRLLKTAWIEDVSLNPSVLFFGDLGEQVESSVLRYINVLEARRSPIAAHSPGDPWRKKSTLLLAGSSARAGSLGRARSRRSSCSSSWPATATCWSAATARPMTRFGATSETSGGGIRSSASTSPHTSARDSRKSRDDLPSLRGAEMS